MPSAQALLIPLNQVKEKKYSDHYQAELLGLNAKWDAKREKMHKKHTEWTQKILEAARAKSSMDHLFTIKPYGSPHLKARAIPLVFKMACKPERYELLKLMLQYGANPNLDIGMLTNITPLGHAIYAKAYCNIALLMSNGADPRRLSESEKEEIQKDPELKRLILGSQPSAVNN